MTRHTMATFDSELSGDAPAGQKSNATARGVRAPGPRGWPGVGSLPAMRRDALGLMVEGMRTYGDVVRYKVGPLTAHLICHPTDIAHIFAHPQRYTKRSRATTMIRKITGDGVLVSEGDMWAKQRAMIQPAFTTERVKAFTNLIVERTQGMLDQWERTTREGEAIDVASHMTRLTYGIIEAALFSTRTGPTMGEIERAIGIALQYAYSAVQTPLRWPGFVPTATNRRFSQAMRTLHQRVDEIIAEHRRGAGGDDLLSAMIRAGDADDQSAEVNDRMLRSQTITMLLAGHETTANTLTWLWYLLDQHPDAADRIADEATQAFASGAFASTGTAALPYTDMAVREAMRLYTPIWAIVRRATVDDVIGGFHIRRGTHVVISPWVTHRHPAFWRDAETFNPLRFAEGSAEPMHPCAYIPFGGGQRACVGQHLARLEAVIIAALVSQRFRLRHVAEHRVVPAPGITLRSRDGMRMHLERRGGGR